MSQVDIDAIFAKPAFAKMPANQRDAFKGLVTKLNNKTMVEAVPILLQFMATVPKGEPLSTQEHDAMTEAVMESLNESDRMKFKVMMSVAKQRKG